MPNGTESVATDSSRLQPSIIWMPQLQSLCSAAPVPWKNSNTRDFKKILKDRQLIDGGLFKLVNRSVAIV